MSKSLQKGILFAVCVALVLAISLTLVFFAGGGDNNSLPSQEGQASGVADAAANAYEHGTDSGRRPAGTYTSVSTGEAFYNAIKSNTKDILLTGNITLTSSVSTSGKLYWNDGSKCFMQNTPFSHKIYGAGYTITVQGPHTSSEGMEMNGNDINEYGGLVSELQNGGAIYDVKVVITKGFAVQTWETWSTLTGGTRDYWLNVGGLVGYMNGGSQIDNVYVELADSTVRLASFKYISDGSPPEYVRAGAIVGEMGANATITNVTVNNKGLIVAGKSTGNATHSVCAERWYGAVGNVVGWISARGGNVTLDNIRITGNGTLRGYKVGNIAVAENSNVNTGNFFDNFTGTYESYENGYHKVYVNGNTGSVYNVTNVYRKGSASVDGAGETVASGMKISATLTVPSDSAYDIYFDATVVDDRNNSLAIAFNQAPAASYKYTLVSGNGNTYENYETTSSAIVFRKLPTDATIWRNGNNFSATLESTTVILEPQHRQPALQPYEHGYTTGRPIGTPIDSGSKFEGLFSRTGTVEEGDTGTYYLTDDIVITGFTGKQFAGTLDGNGHTIYIAASDTALSGAGDATNGFAVGGLVGVLTGGTIKNVRVVIDANITVGLESNKKGRIGGVVGRLNSGTLDNVQVVIPSDVTISHNTGSEDSGMGGVVGQALGASVINNVTVQMDGTLAPVGTWTFVSALVAEVPTKNGTPTIDMDNIIVRGAGTFAAEATRGGTDEPPYVSALANFNNQKGNEIVNLNGLIYDFKPTISGGGASAYGIFVNNWSSGDPDTYGTYVTTSNTFQMSGNEYTDIKNGGTHAGNAPVPLDSTMRTINNTVDGLTSSSVAAYFEPGSTNLLRVQVSATWGTERLAVSGITDENGTPLMTSLVTAGDSSSDRFVRLTKEKIAALTANEPVKLIIFEHVSDPALKTALTYTGSALTPEITLTYKGAQLNKDTDYEMGEFAAVDGTNAKVDESTGLPLNAGKYTVTITLKGADHWFAVHGSGGDAGEGTASKTATFEFEVAPKNVTMQHPGDSMAAVYGTKYWIKSDNNVWGLDASLFFDEEVGNVEYTATVTGTDGGSGYASTSGWLKAGKYTVSLSINDKNFAISGNSSIEYPLTITPVDINYTLTVENSVAAVYDGNVRTITGAPQAGSGIISAAHEGSAGTAGDSVTAAVSVTYGGVAAQIQNAGDYVLSVTLSGDDAENYTAALTSSWSEGDAIENNTITVGKRSLDLQWNFDSNVALEYGDAITGKLIAETQLSDAIPYNGGRYTGSISFTVTSATYNGGTAYAPGVAAGTSVTFEVAPVLPGELDENNYTISLSAAGGETKTVEQRKLTVDYDAFAMTAAYGDSISNEWLTEQYKDQIAQSITNIYNNEDVTFKIVLHSRNSGGGYTEINDFADLEIGTTYMAAVVVDGNSNYTIPDSLSNGYDFTLTARALTISGITWEEEGFDGVYDGKGHALKAVLAEGSSIKEGDEGVLELSKTSLTAVNDGGTITVTVASAFADKYTLTGTTSFNVTLDQKTLTISPFTADFLDYESSGSLYTHLTNKDSGLITGVIDGDTITFSGLWATTPATAEGTSYVAAGSYKLNMNAPGNANYKFENNAMSVTINALDIGGAEVAVTWNGSGLTYTAEEQSVSLDSVTVNGVTLPVEWFNLTNNTGTDAKTYTANIAASNSNITGSATAEFTIAPASVTFAWSVSGEIVEGMAVEEVKALANPTNNGGILEADTYTFGVDIGDYTAETPHGTQVTFTPSVTFTEEGDEANYNITFSPETEELIVQLGEVEIAVTQATVNTDYVNGYTSAAQFLANFTTSDVTIDGENFTVTVTPNDGGEAVDFGSLLDVGEYTVTLTSSVYNNLTGTTTYDYVVTATKWTASVAAPEGDLTYDGENKLDSLGITPGDNAGTDIEGAPEIAAYVEGGMINAGTYTVTLQLQTAEGAVYEGGNFTLDANSAEIEIAKRVVEISWTAPADLTYSATAKVPTATINNKVGEDVVTASIEYNGENTDVTVEGFTATVTELTGEDKDNYTLTGGTGITSGTYTITALDVPYEWSFADSAAITYGDGVDKVKALVTLPDGALLGTQEKVTFEVSVGDYSETTSAGSTVTFTVTAKLPEGANADNYNITVNAKDGNTLTIDKAQITFTGNAVTEQKVVGETLTLSQAQLLESKYYTIAPAPDSTYSVDGKLSVTSVTKDGNPITADADGYTFTEAGEYIVTYAITAGENDNYAPVSDTFTATLTVSEEAISLTPTWGEYTFTYNGEAQCPEPTFNQTPDEGAIVYTVTARGDSALTDNSAVNAGEYTVTISVAEGFEQKYEFAKDATLSFDFTIGQLEAQLTWSDKDATYDGQEHILTATVKNKVEGDDVTVEVKRVDGNDNINVTEQGFYFTAIGLNGTDAGNYKLPADVQSGKFEIMPAKIALTWNFVENPAVTYGMTVDEVKELVNTAAIIPATIPGAEAPLTFTVSVGEYTAATNAGAEVTFTVGYNLPEGAIAANYNITVTAKDGNNTLTVGKATLTLTQAEGASLSKVYDGKVVDPQSLLAPENVTVAGMQNGEDAFDLGILSIAVEAESEIKSAAGYKLTVSVNESNYTAQELELTYTVTAKLIGVDWSNTEFTYDGAVHKPTATATNLVGDETLTLTVTGEQTNASESPYTATVAKDSVTGNYMLEEDATVEFTIAPKTIGGTWSGLNGLTYTAGTAAAGVFTLEGVINPDSVSVGYTYTGEKVSDNRAVDAGDYTVTAYLEGEDAHNYALDGTATTSFTIDPATLNVSVVIAGDGVAENTLTWKVEAEVTVSGNSEEGWTLTSGGTSYIVTVTGADGVALDVLQLTLNGSEYNGTPYGTRVQNGKLGVASTDSNYKVELVTPININIVPDISIEINTGEGYPVSAVYSKDKTYTAADDFAGYFRIDGQPDGTWAYSVEGVESGSFSNVGTYTVKATFTITASGIRLENHFTFTITQATVTEDVVLNGEGVYTYGDLTADSTVSVTVTYSDGNTATVNATFEADTSTGGYVIAGERVTLTLRGDDGEDDNYAQVDGQTVQVKINKYDITADISFADIASAEGVLMLPYIGQEGYAITAEPVGVRDGDAVELTVDTVIINAQTYTNLGIALLSDVGDSANYNLTGTDNLSVRVTPAEITVEWSNFEFTYDGTAKVPTATAKDTFDSDEVTLTVTVTGANATDDGQAINAGDYTATVKAFTQGNYTLTADAVQSFTVAKADATLRIDDYNTIMGSVYTGSAVTITPTINGAEDTQGIVVVSITNEAGTPVQEIVNAGKYNVTLSITDNMNYKDASESFEVKVSPASLDVIIANTSFEYGDTIDLGASVTALGDDVVTVAIDSVTVDNEAAELKNVGTYTVTYKLEGEDSGNYSIAEGGSVIVTITAKELNIIWSEETFTYNGSAQAPAYTADFIEGEEIELTVTITGEASEGQAINAGEYTATIAAFEQGNYKLTSDSTKTFTIGKANLTLDPSEVSFSNRDEEMMDKYSESKYKETIKADVTVTGVGNDGEFNEFTVTTSSATFTEGKLAVGDYTFTISVASGNYNDATFTVKVTELEVVTLTATPSSYVYTGSPITFTYDEVLPEGVEITYTVQKDSEPVESVLDAGNYTVTFTVSNSAANDKWYEVTAWTGTISPATVTAEDVQAVYGDVFTAAATGTELQRVGGWQIVTFNGSPVEVTVTVTDATARAGETYLGAGGYTINIQLVSSNFTFGASSAQTKQLTVARKQLELAPELPSDLTYSSDGIVIGTPDHASQLVGDDAVEVTMLIDGQPYVAGETVLSAGEHTVTFTITDGNYGVADTSSSTFTVAKKYLAPSINVAGDTLENNSTLEMDKGENMRVETAIDNFLADNGIKEGEYTLSVKDASGADKKLDEIAAWAPGTYTVTVALGDNYDGRLTFSIVVKEGTTAQIPEPPALPSTPLEDSGSSLSTTDWLFPLIIAVECLIAAVLVAAIVIAAIKRSK